MLNRGGRGWETHCFVSTQFNKRFHIFRAHVSDGKLENIVRLTGETKSDLPRYYYSQYDMEINPVWTRDGLRFFSSPTEDTFTDRRILADEGGAGRGGTRNSLRRNELKARPDVSPDGSRMVYSSYLGGSGTTCG